MWLRGWGVLLVAKLHRDDSLHFFSIDEVSYMPQLEVWVEFGWVI